MIFYLSLIFFVVAKGRSTLSAIERSEKSLRRRTAAALQLEEEKQATIKRLLHRTTAALKNGKSLASVENAEEVDATARTPSTVASPCTIRYTQHADGRSFLSFP